MNDRPLDWIRSEPGIAYQRCGRCGKVWLFRREFCPECGGAPGMHQASGRGIVHARTLVQRAPAEALKPFVPYLIVLVDAEEGFRLMAHGEHALAIGDLVKARFQQFGETLVPFFHRIHG
jgi:uncharacterized OB-fold protein